MLPLTVICTLAGLGLIVLGLTGVHRWILRGPEPLDRRGSLVEDIIDPREAATTLLFRIALEKGEVPAAVRDLIGQLLVTRFESTELELSDLMTFGREAAVRMGREDTGLKAVLRPIDANCALAQKQDLIGMLQVVADQDGGRNVDQQAFIARVRRILGVF